MEECLKLLKGSSDEQRMVGLLLATKLISGHDSDAVRKVFDAIGFQFINRLLKTGMGQFSTSTGEEQQNYLNLAISILAAFCRVPDLACSPEIIDKVPALVDVLATPKQETAVVMDACECLLGIAAASEKGLAAVCMSKVFVSVTFMLHQSPSDGPEISAAVNLLRNLITKVNLSESHAAEFGSLVPPLARHLSSQQSLVKFAVLDVMRILLIPVSSTRSVLCAENGAWSEDVRSGLGQILHSRVAPEHRRASLELVEEMVEILGCSWLVGNISFPDTTIVASSDRFLTLVVESLRVEVPVTLNETNADSSGRETREDSQRSLATYYALLEHILNFISEEEASSKLDTKCMQNIISAVHEIIGTVLEQLEDAKDRNVREGDELLSSVRLVGRFLAEVPAAHKSRVLKLLGFMLSVTATGETSSFYAVQFMTPALVQLTTYADGCEALVSCEGHKQLISYIIHTLDKSSDTLVVDVVDILINVQQMRNSLIHDLSYQDFLPALSPLLVWAVKGQKMEAALVTCLCMSVLGMTDEAAVKDAVDLQLLGALLLSCLQQAQDESCEEKDLIAMIVADFSACVARYPSLTPLAAYNRH